MQKSKFTFIELLVVVAIISLLAAMILPALGTARLIGKDKQLIETSPPQVQLTLEQKLEELRKGGYTDTEHKTFVAFVEKTVDNLSNPQQTIHTNTTYPQKAVKAPVVAVKAIESKTVSRETVVSIKAHNNLKGMQNVSLAVMDRVKADVNSTLPVFGTYVLVRQDGATTPPIKPNYTFICKDETNFYYKRD
jgi:prepilin-type N-terminal cleavage/methylation domain-containing protein